jgi:hypothetical protein
MIRMNRQSGTTMIGALQLRGNGVCAGQPGDISLVSGLILLDDEISPSAACLLVVDPELRLSHTLYGFNPEEVEPGHVVLTENMIHFAPVHAERLQFADLVSGRTRELYPPQGDRLRAELAGRNQATMPSEEVCARLDDPCDSELFDETVGAFATNRRGRFAVVVNQTAEHSYAEGEPPKITAEQSVLYIYQHAASGWTWCESLVTPQEAAEFSASRESFTWKRVEGRCKATKTVVPDMTSAQMNPFVNKK